MHRDGAESICFADIQSSELGLAESSGILQHGLKDRLQLPGRTADDTQHLRGRGLLLQRLAEIVGALAQLIEQTACSRWR